MRPQAATGTDDDEDHCMTFRWPGDVEGSYGYRGNSGKKWTSSKWESYGHSFDKAGDVVGCGVIDDACFFTKNGELLGVAFRGVQRGLYPTVGLGYGDTVEGNFGQKVFTFDLDWERMRQQCF